MRSWMAALVMALSLVLTVPAMAQTHSASNTESDNSSVPINSNMVGGGVLALVTASGLLSLYEAGMQIFQGTPLAEALEVSTGFPLLAAAGIVVLGGIYGQDIFKQVVAPLYGSDEPSKPATKPSH